MKTPRFAPRFKSTRKQGSSPETTRVFFGAESSAFCSNFNFSISFSVSIVLRLLISSPFFQHSSDVSDFPCFLNYVSIFVSPPVPLFAASDRSPPNSPTFVPSLPHRPESPEVVPKIWICLSLRRCWSSPVVSSPPHTPIPPYPCR